jgi:hypothetical protein
MTAPSPGTAGARTGSSVPCAVAGPNPLPGRARALPEAGNVVLARVFHAG